MNNNLYTQKIFGSLSTSLNQLEKRRDLHSSASSSESDNACYTVSNSQSAMRPPDEGWTPVCYAFSCISF